MQGKRQNVNEVMKQLKIGFKHRNFYMFIKKNLNKTSKQSNTKTDGDNEIFVDLCTTIFVVIYKPPCLKRERLDK